jgi:hypothetical protein
MEELDSKEPRPHLQWDWRELNALISCALRFDGYQWFEDNEREANEPIDHNGAQFVISSIPSFDEFLNEPNYDLPVSELQAMHFLLQRAWFRKDVLETNSFGSKIFRELFLLLCREPVDPVYRDTSFIDTWERDYLHDLDEYEEMVRHSLNTIEFTSKELWQRERV